MTRSWRKDVGRGIEKNKRQPFRRMLLLQGHELPRENREERDTVRLRTLVTTIKDKRSRSFS
ncbi:hypothetical protein WN48_05870 [Eufriesea mexicana]|uniref:Uncharacterized protein n=1 Tax=Eufriesea mexicana TaxID=516756 RepID=A0A310S902_9HYME|nr:hypothetical protein WN48_05870 [Eufriesea mexicana]